jgi:hypothetical protein
MLVARGSEDSNEAFDEDAVTTCSLAREACRHICGDSPDYAEKLMRAEEIIRESFARMRRCTKTRNDEKWTNCWSDSKFAFEDAQAAFVSWYVNTFTHRAGESIFANFHLIWKPDASPAHRKKAGKQQLLRMAYAYDELGELFGTAQYRALLEPRSRTPGLLPSPLFSTAALRKDGLMHAIRYGLCDDKSGSDESGLWLSTGDVLALYDDNPLIHVSVGLDSSPPKKATKQQFATMLETRFNI